MFSMACTHFCLFFVVVVDLQTCQFLRTTQATLSCLQTQISCSSPRTMMTLVISTTSSMFQFSNLVTMVLLYCVLLCLQLSISLMPSTGHLNQTRRNHRQILKLLFGSGCHFLLVSWQAAVLYYMD